MHGGDNSRAPAELGSVHACLIAEVVSDRDQVCCLPTPNNPRLFPALPCDDGFAHSPCSQHGLPSNIVALITSGCGKSNADGRAGRIRPGPGRPPRPAPARLPRHATARLAVGETAIMLHLPLPNSMRFNRDGGGVSTMTVSRTARPDPAAADEGLQVLRGLLQVSVAGSGLCCTLSIEIPTGSCCTLSIEIPTGSCCTLSIEIPTNFNRACQSLPAAARSHRRGPPHTTCRQDVAAVVENLTDNQPAGGGGQQLPAAAAPAAAVSDS